LQRHAQTECPAGGAADRDAGPREGFLRPAEIWGPALLVGMIVAGLTVLVWAALVRDQHQQALRATAAYASSVDEVLRAHAEAEVGALEDLAAFWSRFGRRPLEPWQQDAEDFLGQRPAVRRVVWYDPDGRHPTRVAGAAGVAGLSGASGPGASGADGVPSQDLLERAASAVVSAPSSGGDRSGGDTQPWLDEPFTTEDGSVRVHMALPVRDEDGTGSVLLATLDATRLVESAALGRAPDFSVRVAWDGLLLHRQSAGAADAGPVPDWWVHETPVEMAGLGARFDLRLRPSPERARRELRPLPRLVLVFGLLGAVLLTALLGTFQLARRRARALGLANRELVAEAERARRAEADVRRLNSELEWRVRDRTAALNQAVEDLEAFNYSVSHDLRSPLGAVVNLAAILEEDQGERLEVEGGLDFLRRIQSSARHAIAMMDRLLEFSRAGRAELRRTKVDVAEVARSAAAEVRAAREDGDRFRVEIDDLPPARGDEGMLRVVFTNLLSNAFKFSAPRETPHVRVGHRELHGEDVYFVQDDGVGFDMRFQTKLFRLLERLHASDAFEGQGIGLAVVSRIIGRHGGRIWAESEPDRGATFFFTLDPEEPGA